MGGLDTKLLDTSSKGVVIIDSLEKRDLFENLKANGSGISQPPLPLKTLKDKQQVVSQSLGRSSMSLLNTSADSEKEEEGGVGGEW